MSLRTIGSVLVLTASACAPDVSTLRRELGIPRTDDRLPTRSTHDMILGGGKGMRNQNEDGVRAGRRGFPVHRLLVEALERLQQPVKFVREAVAERLDLG